MRASSSSRNKWRFWSNTLFPSNRAHPHVRRLATNAIVVLSAVVFVACQRVEPAFAEDSRQHESTGQTAQSSPARAPGSGEKEVKLPSVRLEGTYFSRDGRRFLPIGAHWVPARAGLAWPIEWNPKEIEADFSKMRELGFNTVRFDLFWAWFEPRPGDYNPEAFRQLDYLISLAHRYQIYLHPTLFIGGEVGEAFWDVPWRHGRHPHADPEMLRLQTDHAAELGRRYRDESAILAWDLTDEPPYWIAAGSTTDAMAINWTRLIAGALRRSDGHHPLVVGTSQEDLNHGPFRPDTIKEEVDFFSVHPYSIYARTLFPDPMLSERGTYGSAFQTALSAGAGRPAMVQELGASSAQYDPDRIAWFDRISLFSGLAAGSNGFLLWCFTDTAPENFSKVPYLRAPHETQFGLTTWDRKDRPRGKVLRSFARLLEQLDLSGMEPASADAGIIVPVEWAKPHGDFSGFGLQGPSIIPYVSTQDGGAVRGQSPTSVSEKNDVLVGSWLSAFILARRAGFRADFPRENGDWTSRSVILLPSPLTGTENNLQHVQTRFWDQIRQYVNRGGTVYASVSADAAIPEMEDLFGARLVDHVPVANVTLKVVSPLGDLKPGDTFEYAASARDFQQWGATLELRGGRTIAVDQDGRPALVAFSRGTGKTLLCAYPLELYLASTPSAFERDEPSHRIYRALLGWAGERPLFRTDQPSVEIGAIKGDRRGYAVLANHSARSLPVTIETGLPLRSLAQVTDTGLQTLSLDGRGWKMSLGPFEGAVVEWRQ
jgi:endo-1,4-beta-mannosidase